MNLETENLQTESDLGQNVETLRRDVGNVAKSLKQQAGAKFQDVRDQAADQINQAKVTARDVAETVRTFATEHPFAAFGAGILFGLFLARRKNS